MGASAGLHQFPAALGVVGNGRGPGEHAQHAVVHAVACVQKLPYLVRVVCQLFKKHRCKIHHGFHMWMALQVGRHVVIVLDAVQVDPGQLIAAVESFPVVWLVHVPAQGQIQFSAHCASVFSINRSCPSISGVTNTMPLGVMWKRRASSSGFSPITVPSAM